MLSAMISANKFRDQIFPLINLGKSLDIVLQVTHKGSVYEVQMRHRPDLKAVNPKRIQNNKRKAGLSGVPVTECPLCHSLQVASVCLNKTCTNSRIN